jgi:hypothetical protein
MSFFPVALLGSIGHRQEYRCAIWVSVTSPSRVNNARS